VPARAALKPELRHFPTRLEQNAFAGSPRPELEEAWHTLLQSQSRPNSKSERQLSTWPDDNIRVPREVLDQLHLNTVYTRNGLEGIASLSVYHSLHCLVGLRMCVSHMQHEG
jgi:hypothetical protein